MTNYREILKTELERRSRANSRYSLRAFARDLGMPASRLSEVFSGIHGVSPERGEMLAKKLKLVGLVRDVFTTSIAAAHGRSAAQRGAAELRLAAASEKLAQLSREASWSNAIVGWYYGAVQQLTRLNEFKRDLGWIAARLGITEHQVTSALRYLLRLGHLAEDRRGQLVFGPTAQRGANGLPSRMMRLRRDDILDMAREAVRRARFENLALGNDFPATILALEKRRLPEAHAILRDCQRALYELAAETKSPDGIYTIAMQLFRLDKLHKQEEEPK